MNRLRKDNETYEQYKFNLKVEEEIIREYLKGTYIWRGELGPYIKKRNK